MPTTIRTFRKALDTNSADTSFSAKLITATKPSGDAVVDLLDTDLGLALGLSAPRYVQILPYGSNTNDTTFSMRLWAWNRTAGLATELWVPQLLVELAVTLDDTLTTADGLDDATYDDNLCADTIAISLGDTESPVISPADGLTPASILVHIRAAQLLEWSFDMTGAESGNALFRMVDQT